MKFGLIGRNISYSFSVPYFKEKFEKQNLNHTYVNLDLPSLNNIRNYLIDNEFNGVNITIPYKEEIIPHLDVLSEEAEEIEAVNCINIVDNQLIGHNTDIIGFKKSLEPLLKIDNNSAIIFGNGGAAKAVKYALDKLNIPSKTISRMGEYRYQDLQKADFEKCNLLINATPLGTFPNTDEALPINYNFINENHLAYDLIYNPSETKFLYLARNNGAATKNGLEMLEMQADASFDIWASNN